MYLGTLGLQDAGILCVLTGPQTTKFIKVGAKLVKRSAWNLDVTDTFLFLQFTFYDILPATQALSSSNARPL